MKTLLIKRLLADDMLVCPVKGAMHYLIYDRLGSLRAVSGANAQRFIKQIDYDSFGNIIRDDNYDATGKLTNNPILDLDIPLGFAGGLYDRHTNLVRFGYRDYDPNTGRWTAKDPIDFAGEQSNLYVYVGNDPVNYVDPSGLVDLNLFNEKDWSMNSAANFSGWFTSNYTIASHGAPNYLQTGNVELNAKALAELMRMHGYKDGQGVEILACNSGANKRDGNGKYIPNSSLAQGLANELGVPVAGTKGYYAYYPLFPLRNGPQDGKMITFYPQRQ